MVLNFIHPLRGYQGRTCLIHSWQLVFQRTCVAIFWIVSISWGSPTSYSMYCFVIIYLVGDKDPGEGSHRVYLFLVHWRRYFQLWVFCLLQWCSLESLHYRCAGSSFTTEGNQGYVAHQASCREQSLQCGYEALSQEGSSSSLRMGPHQFAFCMQDLVSTKNIMVVIGLIYMGPTTVQLTGRYRTVPRSLHLDDFLRRIYQMLVRIKGAGLTGSRW